MPAKLSLDFETASRIDLKKCGASRYASDPSTVVLCVAYAFDDGPVAHIILPTRHDMVRLFQLLDGGVVAAWNAMFEREILAHQFGIFPEFERFSCTMQRAMHAGLPAALGDAGDALGADSRKSDSGRRLMLKMTKPRKDGTFWHEDPVAGRDMLQQLAIYCEDDVRAERAIGKLIPALPVQEKRISLMDAKMNDRGLGIDRALVEELIVRAADETDKLNDIVAEATMDAVTSVATQTARLIQWLNQRGVMVTSVDKETVSDALDGKYGTLTDKARLVLGCRQLAAKGSTKKLQAILLALEDDNRVRGCFAYYAARTGRWGGRLVQPQNFPRPEAWAGDAIEAIVGGLDNEGLGVFYGSPINVVSNALRGCIVPGKGRSLARIDFSQIEARVTLWLAGQEDMLEVFRRGEDIYVETAKRMGLNDRQAGKVAVLGLGFGAGAGSFVDFAKKYGLSLTPQAAQAMVDTWRTTHVSVVTTWYDIERAVKTVLKGSIRRWTLNKGVEVERHAARNGQPLLTIKLPSGRHLYYRNAKLDPDGRSISYWGVNSQTKRWEEIETWGSRLFENIVQAIARDILAEAKLRIEEHHWFTDRLVGSVHDEVLVEIDPVFAATYMMMLHHLVTLVPAWAPGLPVKAEGTHGPRYGK